MKTNLLTLIFGLFLINAAVFAQDFEYELDHNTIEFTWDGTNQDIVNHDFVGNMLSQAQELKWSKTEIQMPDGWASAICDKNQCYLDFVRSQQFELDANEEGRLDLHLYTYSNPGPCDTAIIQVCISDPSNPSIEICQTYTFFSKCVNSTDDQLDKDVSISVSPNPTTDFFQISGIDRAGRVEVYNMIGAQMKQFNGQYETEYNVSDLPTGMYFVRVYDEKNTRVLSTVRLKKN